MSRKSAISRQLNITAPISRTATTAIVINEHEKALGDAFSNIETAPEVLSPTLTATESNAIRGFRDEFSSASKTLSEIIKTVDLTPTVIRKENPKTIVIGTGVTMTLPKAETLTAELYRETSEMEEYLRARYKLEPEQYTERLKSVMAGIKSYIESMNSRVHVEPAKGAVLQARWLQTILSALETNTDESILCFDLIMYMATKNKHTLFNERLANRFYNLLHDNVQRTFLALQTTIIHACEIQGRARYLKSTNLEATTKTINSPVAKENFLAYFATVR